MEFEYWWLLGFPLFFGLGWVAARIDIRQLVRESRSLPRSYFRGLNFLLNEQPDKAIEAFIEVVKVDPETVELHFALGSLFRRRGEYDRAIRMHQHLLERADLGAEQKTAALAELGQDYLKAGILDRAEEVFGRLKGTAQGATANQHLLEIYELEKDWPRAIEMTKRVETNPRALAQYQCEIAASEAAQSRPAAARQFLESALDANRKCVRASLQLGDLEKDAKNPEQAIEHWKRIESQDPAYLALAAQRLLEAHRELDRAEEGLRLLAGYLERYPSLDLLDTVFQQTLEVRGPEEAYRMVKDELRRNPTLLGLDRMLEVQVIGASSPDKRHDLELMRTLIHRHTQRLARYRCESCGFKARQFYWRCPACGGWETYPPRRTEEFDLTP
ncbi:MAG TPA: lipopolysaccharide assembly protein LapB [Burkholderiales bacterium]